MTTITVTQAVDEHDYGRCFVCLKVLTGPGHTFYRDRKFSVCDECYSYSQIAHCYGCGKSVMDIQFASMVDRTKHQEVMG